MLIIHYIQTLPSCLFSHQGNYSLSSVTCWFRPALLVLPPPPTPMSVVCFQGPTPRLLGLTTLRGADVASSECKDASETIQPFASPPQLYSTSFWVSCLAGRSTALMITSCWSSFDNSLPPFPEVSRPICTKTAIFRFQDFLAAFPSMLYHLPNLLFQL